MGIGADGWAGLTGAAVTALRAAQVIVGSSRQLELVAGHVDAPVQAWPSPMRPAVATLLADHPDQRIVVLASGDPMFHGVGGTLVRQFGAGAVTIVPHPSSLSLACARLGWAISDVEVISAVGRPLAALAAALAPGRQIVVLVSEADAAARVAALLVEHGYGASALSVLEQLGGPRERRIDGAASQWVDEPNDPLAVVAIDCVLSDAAASVYSRAPGLPDDAFVHDGALTKREVRAVTLAALAPLPGELLWDIGGGSGSIAIEWMRLHPSCRAISVEPREDRRERMSANAAALGVPGLQVVAGHAPQILADLPSPDAIFIGGGLTGDGMIEACLAALRPGGRLVANVVTLEGEALLVDSCRRHGGELVRLDVSRLSPVGSFTAMRPALPVTQWRCVAAAR